MYMKNWLLILCAGLVFTQLQAQAPFSKESDGAILQRQQQKTSKGEAYAGISDQELENYAIIGQKIEQMQLKYMDRIDSVISHSALGRNKYRQIAYYKSQVKKDTTFPKQEMDKFKQIKKRVENLQEQLQEKNKRIAKAHGMKMERFLIITDEIRKDPKLYNRLKRIKKNLGPAKE